MIEWAQFRLVAVPLTAEKPRPCDIEVSSDGGQTWKLLPTKDTSWAGGIVTVGLVAAMSDPPRDPQVLGRVVREQVEQRAGGRFRPDDAAALEEVVAEVAEEAAQLGMTDLEAEVGHKLDSTAEGEDEPEPPPVDRHPQIPEDAWDKLNREQKADVAARMDKIAARNEKLAEPDVTSTDRAALGKFLDADVTALGEDYGIELLPAEEVEKADEFEDGPPPPPVSTTSGPMGPVALGRRRRYLLGKAGLPAEAEEARREELAEIERRLGQPGVRS